MSFPLYPNTTAGLAAIGPVQAMSDRNEAQTYMANGGQMFASGGIASLAEGGSTALPKYKYDPVLQRYTLEGDTKSEAEAEVELLKKKRAMESSGDSGSGLGLLGSTYAAPSGQKLGEALASAGIGYSRVLGGMLPLAGVAGFLGNAYINSRTSEAARLGGHTGTYTGYAAFGDRPNNTMTEQQTQDAIRGIGGGPLSGPAWGEYTPDLSNLGSGYESVGGPSTYSSPSADTPSTPAESNSFESAYGYAHGGIAALAGGGQSHLGDYSDGGRLLRGPGDGVSDSIPATIGDKRPARLADGEFVVPARIVSELGNGSTEAGARKLYAMMDRIQKARSKTVGKDRVAVNSRADKNLPA
jgi:hypothetical protein